jgi:hypothetical protein
MAALGLCYGDPGLLGWVAFERDTGEADVEALTANIHSRKL